MSSHEIVLLVAADHCHLEFVTCALVCMFVFPILSVLLDVGLPVAILASSSSYTFLVLCS